MGLQRGFFDVDERLARLSGMGDPLERLAEAVDFEVFRPILDGAVACERKGPGGRPRFDVVVMFKMLVLEQVEGLSDDRTEFLANDRLSFQRFLGLGLGDKVPDAKTIWAFRETLALAGAAEEAFLLFTALLEEAGVITRRGSIVDATFVDAPRQRNTRAENETIKAGGIPDGWDAPDPKSRHKRAQKDVDGRWAKKGGETHYGYKDHVKADRDTKLVVAHQVTAASVHDSKEFVALVDTGDQQVWADSAYLGEDLHARVRAKAGPAVILHVNEKGYRGHPLTETQKTMNTERSRVRVRVEHVFGHMTSSMGGITVRCVTLTRAATACALRCLAYNMRRYEYLTRATRATALA
jgi:IS5 family transposase